MLEQIRHQLERLVPVHRVVDLNVRAKELGHDKPLARELALIKLPVPGILVSRRCGWPESLPRQGRGRQHRALHLRTNRRNLKIEQFIQIMKPLGLVEICRTGVAAIEHGAQGM